MCDLRRCQWCTEAESGDVAMCHYVKDGCFKESVSRNGANCYFHRIKPDQSRPKPRKKPAKPTPEIANITTRDLVYRRLLERFTLTSEHRSNLGSRGLTADQIDGGGYGSLPERDRREKVFALVEEFGKRDILATPGFYEQDGEVRVYARPGMLVPVRDLAGRVQAVCIRADGAPKGRKYTWLSSVKIEGGVGPGSPIHAALGLAPPQRTIRITEGALKADIAARLSGVPTIAVPGVGNWKGTIQVLKDARAETARIAYDADARSNIHVANPLRDLFDALAEAGFRVELEVWDESDGKGIDDLLHAGKTPTVLAGDEARDELARIVESAAKAGAEKEGDKQRPLSPAERVAAVIAGGELEALYRDTGLLADLARLKVDLPSEFGAIKVGLAKVKGFSARDFAAALKPHAPKSATGGDGRRDDEPRYMIDEGRMYYLEPQAQGDSIRVQICNFTARIVEEILDDDGEEDANAVSTSFRVEGKVGGRTCRAAA